MNPLRPDLLIRGEQTAISNAPQTDAEGQAIRRTVLADVPAGPGSAGQVNALGTIPSFIEYTTQVGEHANALKTTCEGCRSWSNKAWRKYVLDSIGPASTAQQRQTIETLRGRIATEGRGIADAQGKLDVEATLMSFGVCGVLSEWVEGTMKSRHPAYYPVSPMPDATCPTEIAVPGGRMALVTPAQPFGLFKPRDLDALKMGDKRRDGLLFAAKAGKR